MADWWDGDARERYWCEITDRKDVGGDLKCPQWDDADRPYWSYELIRAITPGDIVFHYSTRVKAIVGASVAGGPVEDRPIVWRAHGTVGRAKQAVDAPRPGLWRPLFGFHAAPAPLRLSDVQVPSEDAWIRGWIGEKDASTPGRVAAPFQRYGGSLRGAQGYLTKMPADFVERWRVLSDMSDALSELQDTVASGAWATGPITGVPPQALVAAFHPKPETPYLALVHGGLQERTRNHERLVRLAGTWLQNRGASVVTPHPVDLRVESPLTVLVEAKVIGNRPTVFAVRDAIGQLLTYRHYFGPPSADMAILWTEHRPNPC